MSTLEGSYLLSPPAMASGLPDPPVQSNLVNFLPTDQGPVNRSIREMAN